MTIVRIYLPDGTVDTWRNATPSWEDDGSIAIMRGDQAIAYYRWEALWGLSTEAPEEPEDDDWLRRSWEATGDA